MRILLTTENFDGLGGTETYIAAVATELSRLGHEVAVYSPRRGFMAERVRASGIPVLARDQQPRGCDLILANDASTAAEMAVDQAGAVRVFVAHSAQFLLQAPPLQAGTVQTVVVLNDRVGRAIDARGAHAPIRRLCQPIDLLRFWNLGPVRSTPRLALVNSNYVAGARAQMLERACRNAGLELQWIGRSDPQAAPEVPIAAADIVIGLGRSALEGMAAGRPVIVHGVLGADGWVTPERYPAMEADGFAGLARPETTFDVAALTAELRGFDPELGEAGRDLASAHHSVQDHAQALLRIARESATDAPTPASALDELAHLVRMQWAADTELQGARTELARLRTMLDEQRRDALTQTVRVDSLRDDVLRLERETTTLREELGLNRQREAALRSMRRVRVALDAGAQLDRARAAVRRHPR